MNFRTILLCLGILFVLPWPKTLAQGANQPASDTYPPASLTRTELQIIQDALIWSGAYNGMKDGEWGRLSNEAVQVWRQSPLPRSTASLPLSRRELHNLLTQATRAKQAVDWTYWVDPNIGAWVGYPRAFSAPRRADFSGGWRGTQYSADSNGLTLITLAITATLEEQRALITRLATSDRVASISYRLDREYRQVLSFTSPSGHLHYRRLDRFGGEWRGFHMSVPSGQARFDNLLTAMSADFNASGEPVIPNFDVPAIGQIIVQVMREQGILPARQAPPAVASAPVAPPPGAVTPRSTAPLEQSPSAQRPAGSGTGFVVRREGLLLTNQHVVDGCSRVALASGETLAIVASDRRRDLALLRSAQPFASSLSFRRDQTIDLGEQVLLAGYPLYQQISTSLNLTNGMVTSPVGIRDDPMHFQLNAAMQPGNSGGPVLDAAGLVIGVGVSRLNDRRLMNDTGLAAQGMNYAIRGQVAEAFLLENRVLIEKVAPAGPRTSAQIAQGLDRVVHPVICFR